MTKKITRQTGEEVRTKTRETCGAPIEPASSRGAGAAEARRPDAYRTAPRLSRAEEDDRRAEREVENLRELRRMRAQIQGFPFGVTLIAGLVAAAMIGLWQHC